MMAQITIPQFSALRAQTSSLYFLIFLYKKTHLKMKEKFKQALSSLANKSYSLHISSTTFQLLLLVQSLQYLAMMLPIDGWGIWNYQDGHLQLASNILAAFLITPHFIQAHFDSLLLAAAILYILTTLLFSAALLFKRYAPAFFCIIFSSTLFQLPLLSLFLYSIVQNNQKSIQFVQLLCGLLGLTILTLIVVIQFYFLRAYTFQPLNALQQRYSVQTILLYLLNILLVGFFHLSSNDSYRYLRITCQNIIFLVKFTQQIYPPALNSFYQRLFAVLEACSIIISINVISKDQIIAESSLLVWLLFIGSLVYLLSSHLVVSSPLLRYQELFDAQVSIAKNQYCLEYFYLYTLIMEHERTCERNCTKQAMRDIKKLLKPVLQCMLLRQLDQERQSEDYEETLLFYISFLATYCKKPLIAFVELKKFEADQGQKKTLFFQVMRGEINQTLQTLIVKQQQQCSTENATIEIGGILNSIRLEQNELPKIVEMIDMKIRIWTEQIKGFDQIYDLLGMILAQSKMIQDFSRNLRLSFALDKIEHVQMNANVIELKIASIYFCAVMNDYYSCYLCEQKINEIYSYENLVSNEILNNSKMVNNQIAILQVSMVKSLGTILNEDKQLLSQYFGYSADEFRQISRINHLMPSYFSEVHDSLLSQYLRTAKSKFFSSFYQIFSKDSQGFVIPQQMKVDNHFVRNDDYVLVGCLSQIKSTKEFILFKEDGKIFGLTRILYEQLILENDPNQTLPKVLQNLYVYALVPNICTMIEQIAKQKTDLGLYYDYATILSHRNFDTINVELSKCASRKELSSRVQMDSSQVRSKKSIKHLVPVIMDYSGVMAKLDPSRMVRYLMKYSLSFHQMQNEGDQRNYFVLEIHEFRKRDMYESSKAYSSALPTVMIQTRKSNESLETDANVSRDLIFDMKSMQQIQQQVNERIQQREDEHLMPHLDQIQKLIGQESYRESISYGPLSQRANFISPTAKQLQFEEFLEREQDDFLQERRDLDGPGELEMDDHQQKSEDKAKQSSEKQDRSNRILQILQKSKANFEVDGAQKSKSSVTSHSSSLSAIQIVKKFQAKTNLIKNLRNVLFTNFAIFLLFVSLIVIHIDVISNNTQTSKNTIRSISGPVKFNRYYCKLFGYAWSLTFNSFELISSSEYIINSYVNQLQEMDEQSLELLASLYDIYISIEEEGLLSTIRIDLMSEPAYDVSYTYFVNFLKTVANTVYRAKYYRASNITELIDLKYANAVVLLRYNFRNVFNMNTKLIATLNDIFFQQLNDGLSTTSVLIIIEVVMYAVFLLVQIWFWREIEGYIQKVILLQGKLQEAQAQELILRMTYLKDLLGQQVGHFSWKRQNFHIIGYSPLGMLGLERWQSQSRAIRDFKQKGGEGTNQKRRNNSVALNSRIQSTKTSIATNGLISGIIYLVFIAYLVGGYIILNEQQRNIFPTQQLTLNFINFTTNLDTMITCGLVIKTQPLQYQQFVATKIYTQKQMDSYRDPLASVRNKFQELYPIYDQNLSSIYDQIQLSTGMEHSLKEKLYTLYSQSYCELLKQHIRFCNFVDQASFEEEYGKISAIDDNRDFLSQGIIGVVSRVNDLIRVGFEYETRTLEYNPNRTFVLQQLDTREFNNAIMEHFIDTVEGPQLFLDLIEGHILSVMDQDLLVMKLYYALAGVIIVSCYLAGFLLWVRQANERLIKTRLSLVNLPIEILTEPHTLSLLKELD